ncbi:MAG: 50S ribosomal protein L25 [Crocinitomicaceae bacterium]|nr:50S ribosomal protein L25 [Crocinitomicaceae bacterium]MDG1775816.1 50S ribosomal protein L25 [Crocinitomicaceae bacterium]
MKKAQLSGSLRASVGKKNNAALRNEGQVPCVLYGSGEQTHFSVRAVDVEKLIFSPDVYQVELDIDGKKAMAIIQAKQMHPVRDTPVHVDFLELNDKKPVKVSLPVRAKGAAPGVLNGGKLRQPYRMLRVVGLPGSLPEEIVVDISTLKIGSSIRVSELKISGMEFNEPANAVVIGVKMARGAADEEEEEESAEEVAEGSTEEAAAE